MKQKIVIPIIFGLMVCVGLLTLKSSMPEPGYTIYDFKAAQWSKDTLNTTIWYDYYDLYYSVYHIVAGGYGYYNEGPYYPSENPATWSYQNGIYHADYLTETYATVWGKKKSDTSWICIGTIHMSSTNCTVGGGMVSHFRINMSELPVPEQAQ